MISPERRASLDAILTIPPAPPAPPSSPIDTRSELDPVGGDEEVDKPSAAVGPDGELGEYEWFLSPPKVATGELDDDNTGDNAMPSGGYDAALFLPPDVLEALDLHEREAGSGAEHSVSLSEVNSLLETFLSARSGNHEASQAAPVTDANEIMNALVSDLERLQDAHTTTQLRLDCIDTRLGGLHVVIMYLGRTMEAVAADAAREATLRQILAALGNVQAELASLRVATDRHEARRPRTPAPALIERCAGPREDTSQAAAPSAPAEAAHAVLPEDTSRDGVQVLERDSATPPPTTATLPHPVPVLASAAAAVPVATLVTPAPTPAVMVVSTPSQTRALTPPQEASRSQRRPSPQITPRTTLHPVSQYQPRPATASPQRRDHAVKRLPDVLRALRSNREQDNADDSVWPVDLDDFESEEGGTMATTPTPTPRAPRSVQSVAQAPSASAMYVESQTPPPCTTVRDKGKARAKTAVKMERGTATPSKAASSDAPKSRDKPLGKAVKVARSKTAATAGPAPRPPPHAPEARAKSAKRKREGERVRTRAPTPSPSTEGTQSKKQRSATLVIPQRDEALLAMSDGRRLGSGKWPLFPRDWNTWRMLKEITCDACLGRVHWPCAGLALDAHVPAKARWHCPDCQALLDCELRTGAELTPAGREDEILPAPPGRCIRPDCCRRRKQKIDVKESDADEYVIKRVVGRCAVGRYEHGGRAFKYLVEWDGYPLNECTWEPARNLPRGHDGRCPFIDGFEAEAQDAGVDLKNKVALLPLMGQWFDPDTGEARAAPQ